MGQKYYLGLDIGTESVGWAVTDENYKVAKRNGKALWGVRLFKEAQTAEKRRVARISRRRVERTRQRIDWLQNIFAEEVAKVDPAFFQRLRESKFCEEDKQSEYPLGRYTLFNDREFNDAVYRRTYPTIYHLRNELLKNPAEHDVRLVYLAIHHIMKNRGHFLFGEMDLSSVTFESGWNELLAYLQEQEYSSFDYNCADDVKSILIDRRMNSTEKRKWLMSVTATGKKDVRLCAIIDLLAGRKAKLQDLMEADGAYEEVTSFSMKDDFSELEGKLAAAIGEEIELVNIIKRIYDWALLDRLRSGCTYLSEAKIKSYEKHQADLKKLKSVLKAVGTAEYSEMFRASKDKLNNYVAYSGHRAKNYCCGQEDFYKYVKSALKDNKSDDAKEILAEIETETFLPKQTVKDNNVVPHQLHMAELQTILDQAAKYIPFLNAVDESGLSKKEQIIAMFRFRIPYYVGPLDSRSEHSWVVRKNEKAYPWNFEQVIDIEKSAERFITRMTAKCSYIGEDVLPKNSLLYSRFMVLNELSNLRIDGIRISVELKQRIYRELFSKGKKVTQKGLRNYLVSIGAAAKTSDLSGVDGDFKATLTSENNYRWLIARENGEAIAEDIIRHIVLFGEDRKLLANWLKKAYGNCLTADEQKKAIQTRYTGWGNLSEKFLTEIFHVDKATGEAMSIMDGLWQTECNLMELLSGRYGFAEAVQEYRAHKFGTKVTLEEYLEDSYASPAIKRAIHQVSAIVSEIEKIMGGAPKRIFVEMAREAGEKGKRTVSRKDKLLALYKDCQDVSADLYQQLQMEDEGKLRSDKFFLYYTQLGRCMYSGEVIELSSLDRYDIDHIYPQSKTKDDSLDNRVLVKRKMNGDKGDVYPLPAEWRKKMRPHWDMLKARGLISAKKYERLTGHEPLSDEQLAGFISRQLVKPRQSTKIVAELLERRYGDRTEVVYVKAGNVASFRQDQRLEDGEQRQASKCHSRNHVQDPLFVKCREVNDFHHAKDAYLNIVVGNVYHVKFTRDPRNFIKSHREQYSLNRMFDFEVRRGDDWAWKAGAEGSIAVVRSMMAKNNILFTRMPTEQKGILFKISIKSAGQGQTPIKSGDPRMTIEKYGGYDKVTGTHFCLVEHTKRKKRVRSIEAVYLMHKSVYDKDPEQYCREVLGLEEPVVLIRKILIDALVSVNGYRMNISSRTGSKLSCKNGEQLLLAPKWHQYIKHISKYLSRCKDAKTELKITSYDGITREQNIELFNVILDKLERTIYSRRYMTMLEKLKSIEEVFCSAEVPVQCRALMQILNLFASNINGVDLKELGVKGKGQLRINKNLGKDSICLIHQSVTGFFEQSVDLLTVGKE